MGAATYVKGKAVHPGVVLRLDYMQPFEISQNGLAFVLGVPPRRINEIVHGRRSITADTAVRLEAALGKTAEYWMGLQASFDIEHARARGVGAKVRWQVPYGPALDS